MENDPAHWPALRLPEALAGDASGIGQRDRLREAIERLQASQSDANDASSDQRAADADMLSLLIALEAEAAEAQSRALDDTDGDRA